MNATASIGYYTVYVLSQLVICVSRVLLCVHCVFIVIVTVVDCMHCVHA